jgi:hypothetical protein
MTVGTLLLSALALALQADQGGVQDQAADPSIKERPICRREGSSGSRMQRRVCHTRAEWQQIDAAASPVKGGSPDWIGPIGGK